MNTSLGRRPYLGQKRINLLCIDPEITERRLPSSNFRSMFSNGRYISPTTNHPLGPTLSMSHSDNRDPISSAILKASAHHQQHQQQHQHQQHRGKSPMTNAAPLSTHSYYTRSKSVCGCCLPFHHILFMFALNLLVIFQILKCTVKKRKLREKLCRLFNAISHSLIFYVPNCFLRCRRRRFQWELLWSLFV